MPVLVLWMSIKNEANKPFDSSLVQQGQQHSNYNICVFGISRHGCETGINGTNHQESVKTSHGLGLCNNNVINHSEK